MISSSYILSNLKTLDRKYRKTTSPKESLFYSKLAILELCGWVEESMDDIVLRCATRHLKNNDNKVFVQKQIVKRTHGFDYEFHFRRMLIQLIGIINVEKLEKNVDQIKKTRFKAALSTLKSDRDPQAHTHIKGVARVINAPSVTLSQFPFVLDGLREYDRVIRSSPF